MTKYEQLNAALNAARERAAVHRHQMLNFAELLHSTLAEHLGCPTDRIRFFKPVGGARIDTRDLLPTPTRLFDESAPDETYLCGVALFLEGVDDLPINLVCLRLGRASDRSYTVAFELAQGAPNMHVPEGPERDLSAVCDRIFEVLCRSFDERFAYTSR